MAFKEIKEVADIAAQKSKCKGLKVGSVIYDPVNHVIFATGHNTPIGRDCKYEGSCLSSPTCLGSEKPSISYHAELNAIWNAIKYQINLSNRGIYVTHQPCIYCLKFIAISGIKELVIEREGLTSTKDLEVFDHICAKEGIRVIEYNSMNSSIESNIY